MKEQRSYPALAVQTPPNLHMNCRWVASVRFYCFQRPAAKGGREACKPPERTGVPYDEMWVYKEPITNHAG